MMFFAKVQLKCLPKEESGGVQKPINQYFCQISLALDKKHLSGSEILFSQISESLSKIVIDL